MSDEWQMTRLAELVEFRNGVNFSRAAQGQSVKIVGVSDFKDREVLSNFSNVERATLEGEVGEADLLAENDLLFVRSNGNKDLIGRCIQIKMVAEPLTFSGFTIRARMLSEAADPAFLSKVVRSPMFKQHLNRLGGGSSISNLNQKILSDFEFPLPSLPQQLKIVDILGAWDEAIEKAEALRLANLRRGSWLRSQLLTGKVRLSGFSGDWSEVRLSEVLHEHGTRSTGGEEVFSVSVHKGIINQIEHLGRSFAASETAHYGRVLPGDLVYTKSPTGEFPLGIIKQSRMERPVIVSPLYGVFTPATRELGAILDAYFESPVTVRNYLHPLVQKGAKNTIAISNKRFLEGELTIPLSPAEQQAIAEVIEVSRFELLIIDQELSALNRQRRALMQKLLSGEWPVAF